MGSPAPRVLVTVPIPSLAPPACLPVTQPSRRPALPCAALLCARGSGFPEPPGVWNRGPLTAPRPCPPALSSLDGDLAGRYYALKNMTEAEQQQLIDDHFLFDKPVSPLLLASGMARDWPDARGIWCVDTAPARRAP